MGCMVGAASFQVALAGKDDSAASGGCSLVAQTTTVTCSGTCPDASNPLFTCTAAAAVQRPGAIANAALPVCITTTTKVPMGTCTTATANVIASTAAGCTAAKAAIPAGDTTTTITC